MSFAAKTDIFYRYLFLIPVLLALCCFANSLNNGFVYDDRFQVVEAAPVLADLKLENIQRIFDRDIWAFFKQNLSWQSKIRSIYYRPVFALFVMFNYQYAGLNPFWWHMTSLLLHLIAIILGYFLLLTSQRVAQPTDFDGRQAARWSGIGAIIFAIHPAQSESVAWIAAYVNALSAIFIFGALLAYLRGRQSADLNYRWLGLSLGCFFLAILTKEVAIVVPAIILTFELVVLRNYRWSRILIIGLSFSLITGIYLLMRIHVLGALRPATSRSDFPDAILTLTGNLTILPALLAKYLQLIIWPFQLNPMYSLSYITSINFINFYLPILVIVGLTVIAVLVARNDRVVRIGLILMILPLLPVLDIRSFKLEDLVHDRYLYLSLLGAGLLLGKLISYLNRRLAGNRPNNPAVITISAVMLILCCAITIKLNTVWADEWQLWQTAYESVPQSCTVNLELGRLNDEENRLMEAKIYYEQAKQTCPDSLMLSYKLGMLYGNLGDLQNAQSAFQQMLKLTENPIIKATAYFNLGLVYERQGELPKAIEHYQKGLELNPGSKNAESVRNQIVELQQHIRQ